MTENNELKSRTVETFARSFCGVSLMFQKTARRRWHWWKILRNLLLSTSFFCIDHVPLSKVPYFYRETNGQKKVAMTRIFWWYQNFFILYQEKFVEVSLSCASFFLFSIWRAFLADHCKWRPSPFLSEQTQTNEKQCSKLGPRLAQNLSGLDQNLL